MTEVGRINGRIVSINVTKHGVSRVRIKPTEITFRFSEELPEDKQDEIYDAIIKIACGIGRHHPNIRVKILNTDSLDKFQLEIGDTGKQTIIYKYKGKDY